jgi:hypothetical protein
MVIFFKFEPIMAEDKKNPEEASNIFHSIMKASVKLTDEMIENAVYEKFNVRIERQHGVFGYADNSTENRHSLSKEITWFIDSLKK